MPSVGSGSRIPPGGTGGQVLRKKSGVDFDLNWYDPGSLIGPQGPPGAAGAPGAAGGPGAQGPPGAPGSSQKIVISNVALGSQSGSQTDFTWYTIPDVAIRGFASLFTVTANTAGQFDVEVRGSGSSSGTLLLQAFGVTSTSYSNSLPWYVENDSGTGTALYVGIRNTGSDPRTYTLTSLRVERFA